MCLNGETARLGRLCLQRTAECGRLVCSCGSPVARDGHAGPCAGAPLACTGIFRRCLQQTCIHNVHTKKRKTNTCQAVESQTLSRLCTLSPA